MDTLPLIRGRISLEDALDEDKNMVQELSYPEKRLDFWCLLFESRAQIEEAISQHLHISRPDFDLGDVKEWIHGSFNACLPIHITANSRTAHLPPKCIIRFPLPYKIGEEQYPGNVDEKLRCEAATYIWLQRHCHDIPIPRLLGFGFPQGQSFTELKTTSLLSRIIWYFRNAIARVRGDPILAPYVQYRRNGILDLGYLIIEHVNDGQMLFRSWEANRTDPERRANLFTGLSRIMLSRSRHPLPRIGSWTINNSGFLSLTNRPLTLSMQQQENAGTSTEIPRDLTYTAVELYFLDLIACQCNRIRGQPNSIHNTEDGESQLAALAGMRALLPKFVNRQRSAGPFFFALTDLHPSNIFVDENWNITNIIDLEWACVRPAEMINPPYWISGYDIDDIALHMKDYLTTNEQFMECFEQEEMIRCNTSERTQRLRDQERGGTVWYTRVLDDPGSLIFLFTNHILPQFTKIKSQKAFDHTVAPLWDVGISKFIAAKLEDEKRYFDHLREIFQANKNKDEGGDAETKEREQCIPRLERA